MTKSSLLLLITLIVSITVFTFIAAAANDYQYAPVTSEMKSTTKQILDTVLSPANTAQDTFFTNPSSTAQNSLSTYALTAQLADDFGGRMAGSDQLENALDWIIQRANEDKGKFKVDYTVTAEKVMVPHWIRGEEWVTVKSPKRPSTNQSIGMIGLGLSNGTNGEVITASLFVVSSHQDLLNKKAQAAGKIVLFNFEKWTSYGHDVAFRSNAAKWCAEVNCRAALIRSVASYGMRSPHTGVSQTSSVPAAAISIADANQLTRQFNRGIDLEISMFMGSQRLVDRESRNIIFDLPGTTKPNEVGIVMGGHIDSWSLKTDDKKSGGNHGVMDDGASVVAAWNAIRTLASLGIQAPRTIRAVAWVNEEITQTGAEAYYNAHKDELNVTSLALESDIGPFSPWSMNFYGHEAARNQLIILSELIEPLGSANITKAGGAPGEDISPLCAAGVPCGGVSVRDFRSTNYSNNPCRDVQSSSDFLDSNNGVTGTSERGYFWFHHSAADSMETVDAHQLQVLTANFAVWAYSIASLPELLPRTGPVPPYTPPNRYNNNPGGSNNKNDETCYTSGHLAGLFFGGVLTALGLVFVGYIVYQWNQKRNGMGRRALGKNAEGDYLPA